MANREELLVIRAARSGQAAAQLALGKRYLFGGAGLPKSEATALYWLDRAAHQDQVEAWLLIGGHIPFEAASRLPQPEMLCVWYERAFDSGVLHAGLVLAKLVLAQRESTTSEPLRRKAWMALEAVAHAGMGEAQWLMAQLIGQTHNGEVRGRVANVPATHAFLSPILKLPSSGRAAQAVLEWTTRAAAGGVTSAQRALAESAWKAGEHQSFLQWALPLARAAVRRHASRAAPEPSAEGSGDEVVLMARCASALLARGDFDTAELERFLEIAAQGGDIPSCLTLGLWYARMDAQGVRVANVRGLANYKKALRWLTQAGEQGVAEAWYATSRIYLKPEFSQRNLSDAHHYARRAADAGHAAAQLELGMAAWRARRNDPHKDIEAAYWVGKAAAQEHPEAMRTLQKIIGPAVASKWAADALQRLSRDQAAAHPLLALRLELAIEFGLSRAEALLLNFSEADCSHCLLIDIRDVHPRSKRRLALIHTNEQRYALSRALRAFEGVDCSVHGAEGNYRQRLYRLRMVSEG